MPASSSARALDRGADPLGLSLLEGVDPAWWEQLCDVDLEIVNRDPALQAIELELCARSRPYFIQRYFRIQDKVSRRLVRLLPNPIQLSYDRTRLRENVILKARKQGASTWIDARMFHRCRFNENTNGVIMAHDLDSTDKLFQRVRMAERKLPEWMRAHLERSNVRELKWSENGSQLIVLTAGSREIGRGSDIDCLHLSEASFYPDLERIVAGAGEAVRGSDPWIDWESTPNGFNEFRTIYTEARDGIRKNTRAHFFHWWDHPANRMDPTCTPGDYDRDEKALVEAHGLDVEQISWRRDKVSRLRKKFQQEHPENDETCFLQSGQPKFDQTILSRLLVVVEARVRPLDIEDVIPAEFTRLRDSAVLTLWVPPQPGHRYLIPSDVAGGGGGDADFSYAEVLDVTRPDRLEQVARARSNEIPPGEWGRLLASLGTLYNEALVAPESNNHGHATIFALQEEGYYNLYFHTDLITGDQADEPGFPTTAGRRGTRYQMLDLLGECITTGDMIIRDATFIRECLTFQVGDEIDKRGDLVELKKRSVKKDGVMANAIGYYIAQVPQPFVT